MDTARNLNKKYQVVELAMGHHQMGETPEETLQALKEFLG
jgi:predicted RNase H-like HicB family nuclease